MNYLSIYDAFIESRRRRQPEYLRGLSYHGVRTHLRRKFGAKGVLETHHIVPSWRGGTNKAENVITLTAREHLFAHLLLAKAYGGREWAGVWAVAGIKGSAGRKVVTVLRNRRLLERARSEAANFCLGDKSAVASTEKLNWIEYSTGRNFKGTRHELVKLIGHNKTAKWEVGDHLGGRTILTRSGWFSTTRFESVAAVDRYRKAISDAAAAASARKNSGANSVHAKAVRCIETGKVYATYGLAAEDTGANRFKIGEACSGRRNKAGGLRWEWA